MGNDLSTPIPGRFKGLKSGDYWAICAARWQQSFKAGVAPNVLLKSTNLKIGK